MYASRLRGKRGRDRELGADRAVLTVVLLSVTFVLLIIGFAGPSVYFVLPGTKGCLYIGVVIAAATGALVWLFRFDGRRKRFRRNPPGSKTLNRKFKRFPLR